MTLDPRAEPFLRSRHVARRASALVLGVVVLLAMVAAIVRPPGSDATALVLPYLAAQSRAAALGQPFRTWDDTVFGGIPLVADPRHQLFYPPSWLAFVLDPVRAMGVGVAIHILVAALGAHALARRLGTSRTGADVAALVYVLAQVTFFDVFVEGFVDYAPGMAWSPWVLELALRGARDRGPRSVVLGALALAMLLLGTHANAVLVGTPLVITAVVCTLWTGGSAEHRARGLRTLVYVSSAGALLAAPRWLPIVAYFGESTRTAIASAPVTFNEDVSGFQLGARLLTGAWVGAVPLALAIVALVPARGATRRWARLCGLMAAAAGAAILALGARSVIGRALFAFPLLRQVNAQGLCLWFVALGVGAAAGHGYDRLQRMRRAAGASELVVALVVVSTLAVAIIVLRGELPFYAGDLRPRIAFFEGIPQAADPAMLDGGGAPGDVRAVANLIVPLRRLIAAGVVSATWLTLALGGGARVVRRRMLVAVVPSVALIVDLAMGHYDFHRVYWERATPPPDPPLAHDGRRIAALDVAGADAESALSGVAARIHGFRGLVGNGLWMARGYADLLEARERASLVRERLEPRTLRLHDLDPTLGRMLDVAWLARGSEGGSVTIEPTTTAPLGRAWIVPQLRPASSGEEARSLVARSDFDPAAEVVVEAQELASVAVTPADANRSGAGAPTPRVPPPEAVTVERLTPTRLLAHLAPSESAGTRWLVFAENHVSGWRAWVDGSETPILRGDLALRVVPLPPTAREVELRFLPRSLVAGLALAAATAMALALASLRAWAPRRA